MQPTFTIEPRWQYLQKWIKLLLFNVKIVTDEISEQIFIISVYFQIPPQDITRHHLERTLTYLFVINRCSRWDEVDCIIFPKQNVDNHWISMIFENIICLSAPESSHRRIELSLLHNTQYALCTKIIKIRVYVRKSI